MLVGAPIFELDRHTRVGGLEVLNDGFVGLSDRWIVETERPELDLLRAYGSWGARYSSRGDEAS
jgi:hypothetical protein